MSKHDQERFSRKEIVAVVSELQIANISEPDLARPNSDLICNLYKAILHHIDAIPDDDSGQLEFEDLERLGNPEHHVQSVAYLDLCNSLRQLLAALGCPSKLAFNLRDLIMPDPNRTDHFLSILLNFCIYRETKMNDMRTVVEETDLLAKQKQELENVKAQLAAEIAEFEESIQRDMPLVQERNAELNKLRQTIHGLNNDQESLQATIRKLKETELEIDKKITDAEFTLEESVQKNINLRSKIVQSPDKLQRTLEEKKMAQAVAKDAEKEARKSYEDMSTKLEVYTKACTKVSKHLTQMKDLQDQIDAGKSVEKELKNLKSKLSDETMVLNALDSRLIEMKGKEHQFEELKKHAEKERDSRCSEALKELDNVKSEVELQRCDLVIRKKQVDAVISEADSIKTKIKVVRNSGAAKQQELAAKCEEVMQQFYKYSGEICHLLPISEDS